MITLLKRLGTFAIGFWTGCAYIGVLVGSGMIR